jgi:hypothetical protein
MLELTHNYVGGRGWVGDGMEWEGQDQMGRVGGELFG